jgi:hypothetical protein
VINNNAASGPDHELSIVERSALEEGGNVADFGSPTSRPRSLEEARAARRQQRLSMSSVGGGPPAVSEDETSGIGLCTPGVEAGEYISVSRGESIGTGFTTVA